MSLSGIISIFNLMTTTIKISNQLSKPRQNKFLGTYLIIRNGIIETKRAKIPQNGLLHRPEIFVSDMKYLE